MAGDGGGGLRSEGRRGLGGGSFFKAVLISRKLVVLTVDDKFVVIVAFPFVANASSSLLS